MRTLLISTLTIVILIDSLGWTFGVLPVLKYAHSHRDLPTIGRIRLLSGPMETLGIEAIIVTGIVFVVVSGLKLLAAYWIWQARLDGAILEIILLGLSAIFWYAFQLPFGWLGGIIQIVLLALVWSSLS